MPISVNINGIHYTVDSEDDLVALHKALRRLDTPSPVQPKTKPKPVARRPVVTGKARIAANQTGIHQADFSKLQRFFEVMKNAGPSGMTPDLLAAKLGLPEARSLAAYIGVVRQTLKALRLNYQELVQTARASRRDDSGKRSNHYMLTERGRREADDVIKRSVAMEGAA